MQWLYRFRWIHLIFLLGFVAIVVALWYSNQLAAQLAKEEQNRIRFYVKVIEFIATAEPGCEVAFLFQNVIRRDSSHPPLIAVPAIITDEKGNPIGHNLEIPSHLSEKEKQAFLQKKLKQMKRRGLPPLKITYAPGKYNYVYYMESDTLRKLYFYPYVAIAIFVLFVVILLVNFYITRRNEQDRLWVALAKETAHQLGTPISGLLAWMEVLKEELPHPPYTTYWERMEKDLKQLQKVTERFSKIGSSPVLKPHAVVPLLKQTLFYIKERAAKEVTLKATIAIPEDFSLPLEPTLFQWVIENLLKNALDACKEVPNPQIELKAYLKDNHLIIEVIDNGTGILPQHRNRLFTPGFSTKAHGWGIGLSLAKRVIEQIHKGKIFLKWSEAGKGSVFCIILRCKLGAR